MNGSTLWVKSYFPGCCPGAGAVVKNTLSETYRKRRKTRSRIFTLLFFPFAAA